MDAMRRTVVSQYHFIKHAQQGVLATKETLKHEKEVLRNAWKELGQLIEKVKAGQTDLFVGEANEAGSQ